MGRVWRDWRGNSALVTTPSTRAGRVTETALAASLWTWRPMAFCLWRIIFDMFLPEIQPPTAQKCFMTRFHHHLLRCPDRWPPELARSIPQADQDRVTQATEALGHGHHPRQTPESTRQASQTDRRTEGSMWVNIQQPFLGVETIPTCGDFTTGKSLDRAGPCPVLLTALLCLLTGCAYLSWPAGRAGKSAIAQPACKLVSLTQIHRCNRSCETPWVRDMAQQTVQEKQQPDCRHGGDPEGAARRSL